VPVSFYAGFRTACRRTCSDPRVDAADSGTVAAVGVGERWLVAAASALALVGGAAGCGSDRATFANEPPPAATITVTASIGTDRVRVSPRSFGAGPITLIVSNQSGATQRVTFETDEVAGSQGGIQRATGPVADHDTATLQADPREGTYRLGVADPGIEPAAIEVGAARPSSQGELLQP
jgi:hypothetical protein